MVTRESPPRLPCTLVRPPPVMMMFVPPISIAPNVLTADAPGVSSAAVCGVRPNGSVSSSSRLITRSWRMLRVSIVGAAPDTVIVSLTLPTRRSAFTVVVAVPTTSMPSRFTVVNPANVKATV